MSSGSIVIELGQGRRIRVDRDFDAEALRRVIDVLDRRR
jgi:transposase